MEFHAPVPRTVTGPRLFAAFTVTVVAASVELIVARQGHSLFLMADAVHLLSHLFVFLALFLPGWTNQERSEDWAAISVLCLVMCIATCIGTSSMHELLSSQPDVPDASVLLVSILGLIANIISAYLFMMPAEDFWSFRAALVHELSDAFMAVISLIGAVAIKLYRWPWVDPGLSLCVGVWLFVWSSRQILRRMALGPRAFSLGHRHP